MSDAMVLAKATRVMQAASYATQAVISLTQVCADLPRARSLTPLWQALRQLSQA
jgi:hypothetical protein